MSAISFWTIILGSISVLLLSSCGQRQFSVDATETLNTSLILPMEAFGELPVTPDGSSIIEFKSMLTSGQSAVTQYATELKTGGREALSVTLGTNEALVLVAKVRTSSGKELFIVHSKPNQDMKTLLGEKSFFEGYVSAEDLRLVSSDIAASETVSEPDDALPASVPVEEAKQICQNLTVGFRNDVSPNPEATAQSGPRFYGNTSILPGHYFRTPSTDNRMSLVLAFDTNMRAQMARIEVSVNALGTRRSVKIPKFMSSVVLNPAKKKQVVDFVDIIDQSKVTDWIGVPVRFSVYVNEESPTPECSIDRELASPLVLDFTGQENFQSLGPAEAGVQFDINADGRDRQLQPQMGWVMPTTAFLVVDRDHNGFIDSGRELFGTATLSSQGESFENGYEALKNYLEEENGRCEKSLSASEADRASIKLWFDLNSDGVAAVHELKSLAEMQVSRFDLGYGQVERSKQQTSIISNLVKYESRFYGPAACGSTGCKSYDIYFSTFEKKMASWH